MWVLLAVGCQDEPPGAQTLPTFVGPTVTSTPTVTPTPTATSPSPTCVLDPAPSGGELLIADADVTLPDGVIAAGGTRRLPDLGGDGRDDLAAMSVEWDVGAADPTLVYSFTIWTDVTADASTLDITSPTTAFDDYFYDYHVGVIDLEATPDVTSDGTADLWLRGTDYAWTLVAGPVTAPIDVSGGVATVSGFRQVYAATDLDGDGIGELIGGDGVEITRCEGPFTGEIDVTSCPTAPDAGWVIDQGDLDGDGVLDLLARTANGDHFGVFDGAFVDGATDVEVTIDPELPDAYAPTVALIEDLDCDGYGDLVWVEERSWGPPGDTEGIAIAHGPFPIAAVVERTDATLHLVGSAQDLRIGGVAHTDPDAAPRLVLYTGSNFEILDPPALPPMLFDASVRGSVDPVDSAWILAADRVTDGIFTATIPTVGDFDDDDLDDVLVVDHLADAGWLYFGASLP